MMPKWFLTIKIHETFSPALIHHILFRCFFLHFNFLLNYESVVSFPIRRGQL